MGRVIKQCRSNVIGGCQVGVFYFGIILFPNPPLPALISQVKPKIMVEENLAISGVSHLERVVSLRENAPSLFLYT